MIRRSGRAFERHAVLLLVAGPLLAWGCDGGGGPRGAVEGFVYRPVGSGRAEARQSVPPGFEPAPGVRARVVETGQQTVTNASGFWRIDGIPEGTYQVTLSQDGFQTETRQVVITTGRLVQIDDVMLQTSTRDKWTIIIFMNADNDLEDFAIQDMNELERIGSSNQVNLIVQLDRTPGFNSSNGDWTDTRRFRIAKDSDTARITTAPLQFMGEVDMGDPRRGREFIEWAQQNFPAERYLFDFWNHGSGWRRRDRTPDPIRRAVSFDDSSGTSIAITELPGMLDVTDPIDIVAFDSSLMQMMEVAYEIRNRCDIVVGSEESPPGEGYPYHVWVGPLVGNPDMTPEELARLIVRETVRELGATFDVTQSAVRSERLPALASALDRLAGVLLQKGSRYRDAYRTARTEAQHYGFGSSLFAEYKDMIDYVERLASQTGDADIAARAGEVAQALDLALIEEAHAGSSVAGSHGLSIWVPSPSNYLTRYGNLSFAKNTRWDDWIRDQGE